MGKLTRKRLSACEVLRRHTAAEALWRAGGCAAANDVSCKSLEINTDYFPSSPHNKNSVSSRGWRSAPRDLTPAQALARYDRRVLRFRRDGPLCDLIAAGGPSPSWRLRVART